jgi:hypothetical protein
MELYSEVFDVCPNCGKKTGYMRVLVAPSGLGEFDLSNMGSIRARFERGDLTRAQLDGLADALAAASMECERAPWSSNEGCGTKWAVAAEKALAIKAMGIPKPADKESTPLDRLRDAGILRD